MAKTGIKEPELHDYPKLGQILEAGDGYLTEEAMNAAKSQAMALQTQDSPLSAKDKEWMVDFMNNIERAVSSCLELERMVNARSGTESLNRNLPQASKDQPVAGSSNTPPFIMPPTTQSTRNRPPPPTPTRPTWMLEHQQPMRQHELVYVEKPEKFNGKREHAWLEGYESAAVINGLTHEMKKAYLPSFLSRGATDWYIAIAKPKLHVSSDLYDLRQLFLKFYVGPEEREAIREELQRSWQRRDEPTVDFIGRMMRLMIRADPDHTERERVSIIKLKLRENLRDALVSHSPRTIEDLNDLCFEIETNLEARSKRNEKRDSKKKYTEAMSNKATNNKQLDKEKNKNTSENNSIEEKKKCNITAPIATKMDTRENVVGS